MRIGNVETAAKTYLAPMAGVCDLAFRTVCRIFGAGMTCAEMTSAKALTFGSEKTADLLRLGPDEHPAAVQIFGNDAECMGRAALIASRISGADMIDINMGCPVGKVVRNGDGCALMRDKDKAAKIVEAVKKSVDPKPVTVKIRKGWDGGGVNAVEFAKAMESAGADAITVHGRTRVQMYSGVADWDIIREVKKSVGVPVIANGDVFSAEAAARILRYTEADAVMIGRGAFGNPWIFEQANAAIFGKQIPPAPTLDTRLDTAVYQIRLAAADKGERIACLEARKHCAWYLKGVPHAGFFRDKLVKIETLEDLYRIIDQIRRELR